MVSTFIPARPFDFPYDSQLDPAAAALMVIDLQLDFLSPDGYFARKGYDPSPLRAILPNVNRLIGAARSAGILIVHTRQGYRADLADMTLYEQWRRKRAGLDGTRILLRSSPGYGIVPEIVVADTDVIVDKTANGAFTYTDLEHILRAKGILHLILTGCTTDVLRTHDAPRGERPKLPMLPRRGRLRERRRLRPRGSCAHGDGRGRHLRRRREDRRRCRRARLPPPRSTPHPSLIRIGVRCDIQAGAGGGLGAKINDTVEKLSRRSADDRLIRGVNAWFGQLIKNLLLRDDRPSRVLQAVLL